MIRVAPLASALLVVLLGASPALAQPALKGTRPQARAAALDPFLWPQLREVVAKARAAEVDPKRGPANAREILEKEKQQLGSTQLRSALDLRMAGIALREHFFRSRRFPEPMRHAQALSTYSRLDLLEPGLKDSIERTLAARAEAGESVPERLALDAAILARTRDLDKKAFTKQLKAAFAEAGVELKLTRPKAAEFILKLGTRDVEARGEDKSVTVRLDLEQVEGGEVVWRSSSFRTSAARSTQDALDAGLEWLARIGGRDLLFRYLADGPVPELAALQPGGGHAH